MSGANFPAFPRTHEGKANCNRGVRVGLEGLSTPSSDWQVVIDFYEALHWVEVYLKDQHPQLRRREGHWDTLLDVQSYMRALYTSYYGLFRASCVFRYEPKFAEAIDVATADSHVKRIRDHVKQALRLP